MADKNFKTLTDTDGKRYKFNAEAFKEFYLLKQREYKAQGKTEQRLRSDLGKNLGVSPDAIRGWKYGYNGPSDLSLIRKSADFLGTDYLNMVQRDGQEDDMNTNVNAAERTTEAEVVNISRQNTTMTSKEEALYGLYTTAINFIDRLSYYFVFSIDWENGSYMNAMIIQAADKIKDDKNVKGLGKEISDNISNFSDRESVMDTFKAMSTCTEEFQHSGDMSR